MEGEKIDCTFDTFDEAMWVHKELFEVLRTERVVMYADLYFILNKHYRECPREYFDYGWTSLMESKVRPCDDGRHWCVKLPEPKILAVTFEDKAIIDAMRALCSGEGQECYRRLKTALID